MSAAAPAWFAARRVDVPAERKRLCPGPGPGGRYFALCPEDQSVDYTDWSCPLADVWRRADCVWGSWLGTPGADGVPRYSDWVPLATPEAAVAFFGSAPMTPWSEDWESGRSFPARWHVPGVGEAIPQIYAVGQRIARWTDRLDWRAARSSRNKDLDVLTIPLAERASCVWRLQRDCFGADRDETSLSRWAWRVVLAFRRARMSGGLEMSSCFRDPAPGFP